ncbi:cell division protein FtsQ/DivIB [Brevibacillus fluminis]|uniref:cell division protein FtsQ/DivIB n=1 Tax=Brevibacillus fluminis TaxID=511487 RepID=UPI003F8C8004
MQQYEEERIPQIKKQQPKRKANRRLLTLLTVFFLAILIVLFVRSPYSKVTLIQVKGNEIYSSQQVITASGLTIGMQFLNVWQSSVQEGMAQLPGVKEVTVERQFPGVIVLNVVEHRRVAFYFSPDGKQSLLLENGQVLPEPRPGERVVDRPLVRSWNSQPLLVSLAKSLSQLPVALLAEISDISLTPTAFDKERITMYMRDGNEVRTIIHLIESRLPWYPSIAKELPKDEKGVVFMLESTWFSKYGSVPPATDPTQQGQPAGTDQSGQTQTGQAQPDGHSSQSNAQLNQPNGQTNQSGDQSNRSNGQSGAANSSGQADTQQQSSQTKINFE